MCVSGNLCKKIWVGRYENVFIFIIFLFLFDTDSRSIKPINLIAGYFTGVHGGIHKNEYGGTLECFQWRKSYRLSRPTLYRPTLYLVHWRH